MLNILSIEELNTAAGHGKRLTCEQKAAVVGRLAAYESPSAIARSLREDFGIEITPQAIARYDPTRYSRKPCPERWAVLFREVRDKIMKGRVDIGVKQRTAHLRAADRMARAGMEKRDAAALLKHAGVSGIVKPSDDGRAAAGSDSRAAGRDRLAGLYPDDGPLARALYPKHLAFFAAGRAHQERCMMAANRVGKTFAGGYETALHLTGRYPHWWEGRRFAGPIQAWVAGDTAETTRDIVQATLMGPAAEPGTGLIPADAIVEEPSRRAGATGAFDTAHVRHVSGGISLLGFKSYDQGRRKFQGTARHLVWLDEEPPADVYDECILRLMTTDGLMLCTFTPLNGQTEIVLRFMPCVGRT